MAMLPLVRRRAEHLTSPSRARLDPRVARIARTAAVPLAVASTIAVWEMDVPTAPRRDRWIRFLPRWPSV